MQRLARFALLALPLAVALAGPTCAQISCVPTGAVARFLAEESALDSIGNRFGTVENGTAFVPGVDVGFAFRFDGVDDYAHVPDAFDWDLYGTDFTIELWARFDTAAGSDALLAHRDPGANANQWIFRRNHQGQNLAFTMGGTTTATLSAPFTWTAGRWYHLALTRAGSTWTFWVDGASIGTAASAAAVPDANAELWIGSDGQTPGTCRAAIDDVWFWNRALAQSEVAQQHRELARRCVYLAFGSGCQGTQGVPFLWAPEGPRLGQIFMLDFSNIAGNAFGFLAIGLSRQQWAGVPLPLSLNPAGLTGCQLHVSIDLFLSLGSACGCGHLVWLLPVPNDPSLIGGEMINQAFFTDPGANPAGITASNAGYGLIGQ